VERTRHLHGRDKALCGGGTRRTLWRGQGTSVEGQGTLWRDKSTSVEGVRAHSEEHTEVCDGMMLMKERRGGVQHGMRK
jgi:hypothetical protein